MRKIETAMCNAVKHCKDWQSANTSVHYNAEDGISIVRLHGNKIAEVGENSITVFDGGWQSVTTKSRLNALCDRFGYAGEGVFQKDFTWFVRRYHESTQEWTTDKFTNGYVFEG